MRLFLVVIFINSSVGSAYAGLKTSEILDLKQAVQYALEHSPSFDTAKKNQEIRRLEYKTAFSKFLPSFDVSATGGLQNNISIPLSSGDLPLLEKNPNTPLYGAINLGILESIYDNGISLTQLSIAELKSELALLSFLKSRDSLILEVVSEFYGYALAQALFEVRKQQEVVLQKQFKTISNQYEQGFITKSDFLRIKTQVQRAQITRVAAENSITLSIAELVKLLGSNNIDVEEEYLALRFYTILVNKNKNIEDIFPESVPQMKSVYDYKMSKIQEKINEEVLSLKKRQYWPQVFVNSGISYSNKNNSISQDGFLAGSQLTWNALLKIEYNVWDWGARKRAVKIAQCEKNINENDLKKGLFEIKAKITQVLADIATTKRNYKLNQELLSLEEQSNRNMEEQYREGKVKYLDFITSLNSLLDAKVQFYTTYFDALKSTAKHRFYEGKLYETLFEK